jgi:3-dehydroquinate synthase
MKAEQQQPVTVQVPGASYSIFIEAGLLALARELLEPVTRGRKVFVLSDTVVWKLWGRRLLRSLAPHNPPVILVPPGERHKRMATVEKITDQLAAQGAERSSILLVFGGGVVGDMGGFAASVYLRGIDYVQIPTTLLAQVDSAIGGKTGVNLAIGKNLVGTFYHPKMVLSDPRVLRTLPERELRAGLFEAIKCAVIGDPELFDLLEAARDDVLKGKPAILEQVIRASAALKARVVSADEKEGDLRRILNFGHTVGHALEAATNYRRFLHGEAIAWGMLAAVRLARDYSLASSDANRIDDLIRSYGPVPPLGRTLDREAVCRHMAADKKVRDGKVHFVLPTRIGEVKIVPGISDLQVSESLEILMRSNPFRASACQK